MPSFIPLYPLASLIALLLLVPLTWFGGIVVGLLAVVVLAVATLALDQFALSPAFLVYTVQSCLVVLLTWKLKTRHDADQQVLTELRFRDERATLTIDTTTTFTGFFLDPTGAICEWNQGAERFTGWSMQEVMGQSIKVLFAAADQEKAEPLIDQARKKNTAETTVWLHHKTGKSPWVKCVVTQLVTPQQINYGFNVTCIEQTAVYHQHQEQLEFMDIAGHELKTPLTSIKLFSQLLRQQLSADNTSGQTMIKKLELQVASLQSLITLVLDITKSQSQRLKLAITTVDITSCFKELKSIIPSQVKLTFPKTRFEVIADQSRLCQFFNSLVQYLLVILPFTEKIALTIHPMPSRTLIKIAASAEVSSEAYKKISKTFNQPKLGSLTAIGAKGMQLYVGLHTLSLLGGKLRLEPWKANQLNITITLPDLLA